MAYDFYRDHQRSEIPDRTREVRYVFADTLFPDSHVVVIQKHCHREATRDRWRHGWRFKSRNDPDKIHKKYEDEQRPDEWDIFI